MTPTFAARLYADVIAPLVLGGAVRPGRPLGGAAAVAVGRYASAVDADLRSRTDLGRLLVARSLTAIDAVPELDGGDWTLMACVHDWLVAASPELTTLFGRPPSARVLELVSGALFEVPAPKTSLAALSRHTLLARLFELRRVDVKVSFWAGSRLFLGQKPPERLLAWKSLRRVQTETFERELVSLPDASPTRGRVDRGEWLVTVERILRLSPLTDLATANREAPAFAWSRETLGLVATKTGRALALRALRRLPIADALAALGRATRLSLLGRGYGAVRVAGELVHDLVVGAALELATPEWTRLVADADRSKDRAFALAMGALLAETAGLPDLAPSDAGDALARLGPIARSEGARRLLAGAEEEGAVAE